MSAAIQQGKLNQQLLMGHNRSDRLASNYTWATNRSDRLARNDAAVLRQLQYKCESGV